MSSAFAFKIIVKKISSSVKIYSWGLWIIDIITAIKITIKNSVHKVESSHCITIWKIKKKRTGFYQNELHFFQALKGENWTFLKLVYMSEQ